MTKDKNKSDETLIKKWHGQYRDWKITLDADLLKLIFNISKWMLIVIFFAVMPIGFTLFSTLVGHGVVPRGVYLGIFYTAWVLLFIALILWTFCKDYERVKEEQENGTRK